MSINAYDLRSNIEIQTVVAPAAQSGTVTSTSYNRAEANGQRFNGFTFVLSQAPAGLGVGTVKIEHSDDNSVWSDAGSDDVIGVQEQAFAAGENSTIGYRGSKQYIRLETVFSTGGDASVILIKSCPDVAPTVID